jgi:hypothetical protein
MEKAATTSATAIILYFVIVFSSGLIGRPADSFFYSIFKKGGVQNQCLLPTLSKRAPGTQV